MSDESLEQKFEYYSLAGLCVGSGGEVWLICREAKSSCRFFTAGKYAWPCAGFENKHFTARIYSSFSSLESTCLELR
jgi:hypothetical protein